MNHIADRQVVIDIYKEMCMKKDRVTLQEVADEVASRGIINARTRKPFTLSTMYYILSRVPDVQLERSKNSTRKQPLLILNYSYPKITQWMLENIEGEQVFIDQLTPELVHGRHVYGLAPFNVLVGAKKVWWLADGKKLITEDKVTDNLRWRQVKIEVLY